MKEEIKNLIKNTILNLQKERKIPIFEIPAVKIEHPKEREHGDYSTNIALQISKAAKIKPITIAELIAKELNKSAKLFFDKIEAVEPGFINIFLSKEYLAKQINQIFKKRKKYGTSKIGKGKTIMVEYAHPNTHKIFHIGHLRNITNGEAIARILEAIGTKVIRANYQGDVGLHIAKCLWVVKQVKDFKSRLKKLNTLDKKIEFLAECYVKGNTAYEKNEKAKEEILKINKQIYNKDPKIKDLWRETRQWSLDYFERIYKRVYTSFDRYYFEDEVTKKGKEIVLRFLEKGIFEKSKGAIIFPGSKYGLHDRVFITKEGNATYEAKEMELARLQFKEYNPDLIIHNVGPEQSDYFKVIFFALEQVFPYTKGREYHLVSGWVRLKGGKMSSRKGNVIPGEWLLDEVKRRIKKNFPLVSDKAAETIAVGAVKYSFLKVSPPTEIAFDFDESISLQGNSGVYLQYTYARACSILRKAKTKIISGRYLLRLKQEKEQALIKLLLQFPEIVLQAAEKYSPNLICNFLFETAQAFNNFYESLPVLKAETKGLQNARLSLVKAASQVIKNGLNLLGIKVLKKM